MCFDMRMLQPMLNGLMSGGMGARPEAENIPTQNSLPMLPSASRQPMGTAVPPTQRGPGRPPMLPRM